MELFRADRRFSIWTYSVSHSRLLLRSTDVEYETRIDVMFKPVRAMKLPTSMSDLLIRDAEETELATLAMDARKLATATGVEGRIFVIESGGHVGYIVAGLMVVYEDTGSYSDESAIMLGSPDDALVVTRTFMGRAADDRDGSLNDG